MSCTHTTYIHTHNTHLLNKLTLLRFNFITGLFLSLLSGLSSNVGGREGREGRPGGPSPSLLSSLSWLLPRWSGYSLPLLFPSSLNLLPAWERARLRENMWSASPGAGETVAMPVNLSALTALKTRRTRSCSTFKN